MRLTDKKVNCLGHVMTFFIGLFLFFLIAWVIFYNSMDQASNQQLFLIECIFAYSTIRVTPIMGLSIMLYWGGIGYKQGYLDEYYEHHSRGKVTGSEAKKLGRMQIIFGILVFLLSVYVGISDVSLITDYCPPFFHDASWPQVLKKLF